MEKLLLSFSEFCEVTGIGPTLGKKLIRENRVVSVRIGERRLIPVAEARAYVQRLVAEAAAESVYQKTWAQPEYTCAPLE
jgi:hypothetical protein